MLLINLDIDRAHHRLNRVLAIKAIAISEDGWYSGYSYAQEP